MRRLIFNGIAQVTALQILAVRWISDRILWVLGNVGHSMLNLVDSKRLALYSQVTEGTQSNELNSQAMELRLLASATQVRDHAAASNNWTDQHTEALNAIGDALIAEIGWEEESVHQYLKGIVESIDGLEYGTEEW